MDRYPELYNGGGRCLISTFDIDLSDSSPTTLFSSLGITLNAGLEVPQSIYRWDAGHPIWNVPEAVPDFTAMEDNYWDDGDRVFASTGAVGGFTMTPTAGEVAIIAAGGGVAVVNSFLVVDNNSDLDFDGKPDAVELFTNEIVFLIGGGPMPQKLRLIPPHLLLLYLQAAWILAH